MLQDNKAAMQQRFEQAFTGCARRAD